MCICVCVCVCVCVSNAKLYATFPRRTQDVLCSWKWISAMFLHPDFLNVHSPEEQGSSKGGMNGGRKRGSGK
jgi:hypothetical protein